MLNVSMAEAQAVFDNHILAQDWEQASTDLRERALVHASRDISSLTYSSTTPRHKLVAAVCEQVLFLLALTGSDNKERLRAQRAGVQERSVEGASERYFEGATGRAISPDALAMLDGYVHRRIGRLR